jgi:hypothetical protein
MCNLHVLGFMLGLPTDAEDGGDIFSETSGITTFQHIISLSQHRRIFVSLGVCDLLCDTDRVECLHLAQAVGWACAD